MVWRVSGYGLVDLLVVADTSHDAITIAKVINKDYCCAWVAGESPVDYLAKEA